jgi:hypothetical protein
MTSNKHEHKVAIFEDGSHVVLRLDPTDPRRMELIATFYEAVHAQDYVRLHAPAEKHLEKTQPAVKKAAKGAPKRTSTVKPGRAPKAKSRPLSVTAPKLPIQAKPKPAAEAKAKSAPAAKRESAAIEVSERQAAVLKGLRSLMNKQHRVEAKAVELAKASSVPLGSLHSILVSLEKKHMIRTERQGSPKFPAIYEVLDASPKRPRTLNGRVHGKEANAQGAR